jgi:hypothetical protein
MIAMRFFYIQFFFISLWFIPAQVSADCWKIIDKSNTVIQAKNIWNLHDRLSGKSALLAELKGEELIIPVDDIQSFTVKSSDKGWFGLAGSEDASIKVKFQDGRQTTFKSDMNLFYLLDAEQKEISISSVRSVERCIEKETHKQKQRMLEAKTQDAEPGPQIQTNLEPLTIKLNNGDILHGKLVSEVIQWKTVYATLDVPVQHIRQLSIESKSGGQLELLSGDRMSGSLQNTSLKIKLIIGQVVDLDREMIKTVSYKKVK